MQSTAPAIDVRGIAKTYDRHKALDNISFSVEAGTCMVLFGPNGAGKTTLTSVLSTLASPSAGTARICGHEITTEAEKVRRRIGVLGHESCIYESLTAIENLRFFAEMYQVRYSRAQLEELLDQVGLLRHAENYARTMSRGMMQRLSLARCLLHQPQVLLLDEPFNGLDTDGADRIIRLIRDLKEQNRSLLITTHQLAVGLELADQVGILAAGRLVLNKRKDEICIDNFQQEYAGLVAEVKL